VGGDLNIDYNTSLTNLCGLYNVNLLGLGLTISENTQLSMDTANALEARLRDNRFSGTAEIYDNNGSGIVCCGSSSDNDNDLICSNTDNCPDIANPSQKDADNDGIGDACDSCPNDSGNDADGDGICGDVDNCVSVVNPGQEDDDNDDIGDACDSCPNDSGNDTDGDGICGDVDNCVSIVNPGQEDGDNDGIGDVCEYGASVVPPLLLLLLSD
jgi:hypothetical protein